MRRPVKTDSEYFLPEITRFDEPSYSVEPAAVCTLTVEVYAADMSKLEILWTATGGSFYRITESTGEWTAHEEPGECFITCSITDGRGSDQATIRTVISETRILDSPHGVC